MVGVFFTVQQAISIAVRSQRVGRRGWVCVRDKDFRRGVGTRDRDTQLQTVGQAVGVRVERERIGEVGQHLLTVGQSVVVGVDVRGIGLIAGRRETIHTERLSHIAQSVAVTIKGLVTAVGRAVLVLICGVIKTLAQIVRVTHSVVVGVVRIGASDQLSTVGHAIAVAVETCRGARYATVRGARQGCPLREGVRRRIVHVNTGR